MTADVRVENPDGIRLNVNITLTLKEWRELAEQLELNPEYWPYKGFAGVIRNAIKKANVRLSEMESVGNI